MLLKKTSSSLSLSKSATMTVRTGDGMENFCVAMSCYKDKKKKSLKSHCLYSLHL